MSESILSPYAVIHPEAIIGSGCTIDPFAVIEDNVIIGEGTHIQAHVHLRRGARIGKNCTIFTGASIGAVPQDLKFSGEATTAIVGDRTVVREYATIHRGTTARYQTIVGSDCLIMAYCHVAHDCIIGDRVILANGVQLGGHVQIEDWVTIGGLSGVHQFSHVGKHSMIGAGVLVRKDVPPYILAGNQPLGFSGINSIGLRRREFSEQQIDAITQLYKLIYYSGLNIGDALRKAQETSHDSEEAKEIIGFIESSRRGIIPASK